MKSASTLAQLRSPSACCSPCRLHEHVRPGRQFQYACKAPEGVTCDSVSGTYANALQNNLPEPASPTAPPAASAAASAALPAPGTLALPRRSAQRPAPPSGDAPATRPRRCARRPRILRLWIKPWEDADRDLNDQGHVYVQVDNGQWLVDHVQRQIRDAYAPLRPPPQAAPRPANDAERTRATTPPPPAGAATRAAVRQALRRRLQCRVPAAPTTDRPHRAERLRMPLRSHLFGPPSPQRARSAGFGFGQAAWTSPAEQFASWLPYFAYLDRREALRQPRQHGLHAGGDAAVAAPTSAWSRC